MSGSVFYFVDEIESTFVIHDIRRVAARFDNVYLFSVDPLEGKNNLPVNVTVFEKFIDWKNFNPAGIVLGNLLPILGIYLSECIALGKALPLKASVATIASNIFKAHEILRHAKQSGLNTQASPFYSFWFYDCIYLAWMKKSGDIQLAVSRAHSGDLYEDHISIRNKLLMRNFQFKYLDGVFPVSDMGTNYLQRKYPGAAGRIKTIYLGSPSPGAMNPFDDTHFTLVSCASFRHHKRIHKIAEMLLHVDFPLTWHHFGDENLDKDDPKIHEYIQRKEELRSKPNIQFIAHGQTSNENLFDFYRSTPVNLFISLSAAEGIPVSIMEAISFGIPVLSTDVGGCREIANEETGILIPLETEITHIAEIIKTFKTSMKNTPGFRTRVKRFWEKHFDADTNYSKFFDTLQSQETTSETQQQINDHTNRTSKR